MAPLPIALRGQPGVGAISPEETQALAVEALASFSLRPSWGSWSLFCKTRIIIPTVLLFPISARVHVLSLALV